MAKYRTKKRKDRVSEVPKAMEPVGMDNANSGFTQNSTLSEKIMALTSVALFAIALVTLFVNNRQADIAEGQLKFAVESAEDSGNQTQAALDISDRLANSSEAQVGKMNEQASALRNQVDILRNQNEVLHDQFDVISADRQTPFRTALIGVKSESFARYAAAGARLNAAIRKVIFLNPVYLEDRQSALAMSDGQLAAATRAIAPVIDAYTEYLAEVQSSNITWSGQTSRAIYDDADQATLAMRCFFVFGPGLRETATPDWWAKVRAESAELCPGTRGDVVRWNSSTARVYALMRTEIDGTPFKKLPFPKK